MNVKRFLPMDSAVKCVLTLRDLSTVTVWRDINSFGHSYAQVSIALTKKQVVDIKHLMQILMSAVKGLIHAV